jgi:hypothetical protein
VRGDGTSDLVVGQTTAMSLAGFEAGVIYSYVLPIQDDFIFHSNTIFFLHLNFFYFGMYEYARGLSMNGFSTICGCFFSKNRYRGGTAFPTGVVTNPWTCDWYAMGSTAAARLGDALSHFDFNGDGTNTRTACIVDEMLVKMF